MVIFRITTPLQTSHLVHLGHVNRLKETLVVYHRENEGWPLLLVEHLQWNDLQVGRCSLLPLLRPHSTLAHNGPPATLQLLHEVSF